METYPFKLSTASAPSITISAQGDLFVYESGDASPRCNLLGYTEQFESASWVKTSITATADVVAAPDGTALADRIVGTAANCWLQQYIAVAGGVELTASLWIKAPAAGPIALVLLDSTGASATTTCDVTTDWQRFRVTLRLDTAATGVSLRIGSAGTITNGKELHVFGAQVERGPNMTSYIPSYGAGAQYGVGETRIRVKPDTGGEIVLRPGQRFRPDGIARQWTIRPFGMESLEGSLIIGQGDFDDANTKNVFKLDATFANQVNITNSAAAPVPVSTGAAVVSVSLGAAVVPVSVQNASIEISNDVGNRVPVTLDPNQSLNVNGNTMAYTNSYVSQAAATANTAVQMLAPGLNVNGVVLNKFDAKINFAANGIVVVLAKSTAPTGPTDGDVLMFRDPGTGSSTLQMDVSKEGQPRVPAGKGIWYWSTQADSATWRSALFTVQ